MQKVFYKPNRSYTGRRHPLHQTKGQFRLKKCITSVSRNLKMLPLFTLEGLNRKAHLDLKIQILNYVSSSKS